MSRPSFPFPMGLTTLSRKSRPDVRVLHDDGRLLDPEVLQELQRGDGERGRGGGVQDVRVWSLFCAVPHEFDET